MWGTLAFAHAHTHTHTHQHRHMLTYARRSLVTIAEAARTLRNQKAHTHTQRLRRYGPFRFCPAIMGVVV